MKSSFGCEDDWRSNSEEDIVPLESEELCDRFWDRGFVKADKEVDSGTLTPGADAIRTVRDMRFDKNLLKPYL